MCYSPELLRSFFFVTGPPLGETTYFWVQSDRADNAIELLSFNWTHNMGLGLPFSSINGAFFRSEGLFATLEGNPGNYPITIRKYIDRTSPVWFQGKSLTFLLPLLVGITAIISSRKHPIATTDFDPFGNSWTYGNNSDGNATRTCPRLFQLIFSIPLDTSLGSGVSLNIVVIDAIPTNIRITVPSKSRSAPRSLFPH